MSERAGAGDHAAEGLVVGAGVDENGIVSDVLRVVAAAEASGGADLDRSGADNSGVSISVVAVENERASAGFGQTGGACASDNAVDLSPRVVNLDTNKSQVVRAAVASLNC